MMYFFSLSLSFSHGYYSFLKYFVLLHLNYHLHIYFLLYLILLTSDLLQQFHLDDLPCFLLLYYYPPHCSLHCYNGSDNNLAVNSDVTVSYNHQNQEEERRKEDTEIKVKKVIN